MAARYAAASPAPAALPDAFESAATAPAASNAVPVATILSALDEVVHTPPESPLFVPAARNLQRLVHAQGVGPSASEAAAERRRRQIFQACCQGLQERYLASRRLILTAALAAAAVCTPEGRATAPNSFFGSLMATYSEAAFKAQLRLSRAQFSRLWHMVSCTSAFQPVRLTRIDHRLWLAAVLYQLGHGSTSGEVASTFGVSKAAYSDNRAWVLQAVIEALESDPQSAIGWPTTASGWEDLANSFVPSIFSKFTAFHGVVAAGDGTLIPIDPYGLSGPAREVWRSRKGFVAQNALVFFDGRQRIIAAEIMHEGSNSDQGLLQTHMATNAAEMPESAYILFDAGRTSARY